MVATRTRSGGRQRDASGDPFQVGFAISVWQNSGDQHKEASNWGIFERQRSLLFLVCAASLVFVGHFCSGLILLGTGCSPPSTMAIAAAPPLTSGTGMRRIWSGRARWAATAFDSAWNGTALSQPEGR